MRAPKCPSCGEERRLRVLRYTPPARLSRPDGEESNPWLDGAEVRYTCLMCGVSVEHWTYPVGADVLAAYGYTG